METLTVLGTGNATAVKCYNTCFALGKGDDYFLVDAGGGNGIFRQLESAKIPFPRIRAAFLSHSHTDHIFGMIWVLRKILTLMGQGKYEGPFTLYCHEELAEKVRTIAKLTLTPGMFGRIGEDIRLLSVADGEETDVLGHGVRFFDIHSDKEKQFGFTLALSSARYPEKKLAFLGDEPFNERCRPHVTGCAWLLCEAFCLYGEREIFKPYEKHHSTVREACELAEELGAPNLVLWHTEDSHIAERKALYGAEGRQFYHGNLFVPDDLDVIAL